jgi:hypothetical protein
VRRLNPTESVAAVTLIVGQARKVLVEIKLSQKDSETDFYSLQPRKRIATKVSLHASGALHIKQGAHLAFKSDRMRPPDLFRGQRPLDSVSLHATSLENYHQLIDFKNKSYAAVVDLTVDESLLGSCVAEVTVGANLSNLWPEVVDSADFSLGDFNLHARLFRVSETA